MVKPSNGWISVEHDGDGDGFIVVFGVGRDDVLRMRYDAYGEPVRCADVALPSTGMPVVDPMVVAGMMETYRIARSQPLLSGRSYDSAVRRPVPNLSGDGVALAASVAQRVYDDDDKSSGVGFEQGSASRSKMMTVFRLADMFGESVLRLVDGADMSVLNMLQQAVELSNSSSLFADWLSMMLGLPYEYHDVDCKYGGKRFVQYYHLGSLYGDHNVPCFDAGTLEDAARNGTVFKQSLQNYRGLLYNHYAFTVDAARMMDALCFCGWEGSPLKDLYTAVQTLRYGRLGVKRATVDQLIHDVLHDCSRGENRVLLEVLDTLTDPSSNVIVPPRKLTVEWVRRQAKIPFNVFHETLHSNGYASESTASLGALTVALVERSYEMMTEDERWNLYRGMPGMIQGRLAATTSIADAMRVIRASYSDVDVFADAVLSELGHMPSARDTNRWDSGWLDVDGERIDYYTVESLARLAATLGWEARNTSDIQPFTLDHEQDGIIGESNNHTDSPWDYEGNVFRFASLLTLAGIINLLSGVPRNALDSRTTIMRGTSITHMLVWLTFANVYDMYDCGGYEPTTSRKEKLAGIISGLLELSDDEYRELSSTVQVPVYMNNVGCMVNTRSSYWAYCSTPNAYGGTTGFTVPEQTSSSVMFPATMPRIMDWLETALKHKNKGGFTRLARLAEATMDYDNPRTTVINGSRYANHDDRLGTHRIIPSDPSILYLKQDKSSVSRTIPEWDGEAWRINYVSQYTRYSMKNILAWYKKATGALPEFTVTAVTEETERDDLLNTESQGEYGMRATVQASAPASAAEKKYIRTGEPFATVTVPVKPADSVYYERRSTVTLDLFPDAPEAYKHRPADANGEPLQPCVGDWAHYKDWNGTSGDTLRSIDHTMNQQFARWEQLLIR